ncbi:MAG: 30S ribosome-binding factor RbfA [Arenicellales bacterium]|jgi:ribosome-binding factor A|nr:30S ribosome-binding factor RbfA [Arenicellales bacterium]
MQGIDRVRRVSELVRRQVSQFILRELADEGLGILSVTAVDMSRDLQQATVFVSPLARGPDIDSILITLEENVPAVRRDLAQSLHLRRVPHLTFRYDESVERGRRLTKMIDELELDRNMEDGA